MDRLPRGDRPAPGPRRRGAPAVTAWLLVLAVVCCSPSAFYVAVEFALVAAAGRPRGPGRGGRPPARRAWPPSPTSTCSWPAASSASPWPPSASAPSPSRPSPDVIETAAGAVRRPPREGVHGIGFVVALGHRRVPPPRDRRDGAEVGGHRRPERVLVASRGSTVLYVAVFGPVIRLLNGLASLGMRLLRVEPSDERVTVHTADELARLLAESPRGGAWRRPPTTCCPAPSDGRRPGQHHRRHRPGGLRAQDGHGGRRRAPRGRRRLRLLGARPASAVGFVHAKDLLAVPAEARRPAAPLARIRRVLVLPSPRGARRGARGHAAGPHPRRRRGGRRRPLVRPGHARGRARVRRRRHRRRDPTDVEGPAAAGHHTMPAFATLS